MRILSCNTSSNKRNLGMDLTRVVASLMVVSMHVTASWKYGVLSTPEWHISEFYDSLCRSAVPLFFMISGAFYKNRPASRTVRKIIYYIAVFFGISLIYAIDDAYLGSRMGERPNWLEGVLNYKYHLWYLPAYIFVLSAAPVLVKAIDSNEENAMYKYLLGLWMFFGIGLNTVITAMNGLDSWRLFNRYCQFISSFAFMTGNHMGYFVLGRFLIKKEFTDSEKRVIYALGVLSTVALYTLTVWYSYHLGRCDERWMGTMNLFIFLQATAVFEFFKNMSVDSKYANAIGEVSTYTFGIYLVHVLFLDWARVKGVFQGCKIMGLSIHPALLIPIEAVIVWLTSFFAVWVIRKIYKSIKSL